MPKLLQRNYRRVSVMWMVVILVCLVRFIISRVTHSDDFTYFGIMNFTLLLSGTIIEMSLRLPDYTFIAPLSKEQREQLLLKGMKQIFRNFMISSLVFLIIPCMIYAICVKQYFGVLVCVTEIFFLCGALATSMYIRFLSNIYLGKWIGLGTLNWILYIFLSGGIGEQNGMKGIGFADLFKQAKGDVILLCIIAATGLGIWIYLKVKLQKELIAFMSDYESSKKIINNNMQR